jgi:hypothetical protein
MFLIDHLRENIKKYMTINRFFNPSRIIVIQIIRIIHIYHKYNQENLEERFIMNNDFYLYL